MIRTFLRLQLVHVRCLKLDRQKWRGAVRLITFEMGFSEGRPHYSRRASSARLENTCAPPSRCRRPDRRSAHGPHWPQRRTNLPPLNLPPVDSTIRAVASLHLSGRNSRKSLKALYLSASSARAPLATKTHAVAATANADFFIFALPFGSSSRQSRKGNLPAVGDLESFPHSVNARQNNRKFHIASVRPSEHNFGACAVRRSSFEDIESPS